LPKNSSHQKSNLDSSKRFVLDELINYLSSIVNFDNSLYLLILSWGMIHARMAHNGHVHQTKVFTFDSQKHQCLQNLLWTFFFPVHDHFRWPDDAMSTITAAMNIVNILPSSVYVLFDDFLYSPNRTTPQNVPTSGSACANSNTF
jgi:hypothetical protein